MRKIVAAIMTSVALVAGVLFSSGAFASPITSLNLVNSWSVNGRVSATAIVGDTVVVGGSFTTATSPTGQTAPRNNIAAFDLRTGALLSSFAGGADGTVRALSYNGSRLFVGGSFTNIGGSYRARLAELDPTTGATKAFTANASSHVYALASTSSRLYVGGAFGSIKGVTQSRLAAIDLGSGNVQSGFSPGFNDSVFALALSSDSSRLYVGGQFTTVAGSGTHPFLVELAASSGAIDSTVYSVPSLVMGLAVGTYANRVYAAFGGVGNQGAAMDTTNGARLWRVYVMGDTQAVATQGGNVVFGFHEGYENNNNKKFLIVPESTGVPSSVTATMPQFMGVFAISLNSWAMVVGGEISYVNGQRHTGIAIFHTATPPPTTTTTTTTTTTARPTTTTTTTTTTSTTTTTARPTTTTTSTSTTAPATTSSTTSTTILVSSGTLLKPFGSVWKYNDSATSTPSGWNTAGYNDSAWLSGSAVLGSGNADESTIVNNRWNTTNLTTWIRGSLNLSAVPTDGVTLGLVADDGAVIYINGVEVGRYNMPAGTPTASTAATAWVTGADEYAVHQITVPASALTTGVNVIAVEVHRAAVSDGDLRFDLQVSANSTAPTTTSTTAASTTTSAATTTAPASTSTTAAGTTTTAGGSVSTTATTAATTTTTATSTTGASTTTTATTAPTSTTTTAPTTTAVTTTAAPTTTAATTTSTSSTTTSSTTTSSTTTSTTAATTTTAPPVVTLLPFGSTWRYNDTEASTPPAWFSTTYSDAAWKIGTAALGAGNGDEATVVANRWNTADVTTWFRTTVNLGFTPTNGINIGLVADDGAAIYVNGVEVARDNLPAGALTQNTLASSWRTGAAEYAVQTFTIPAAAMHSGINVIAVEVHRAAVNDGDIRFDLTMSS